MTRRTSKSQERRDQERAERSRVMDKQSDKEERRRAAKLRKSQNHQRNSDQQTIHNSFYYAVHNGNTHHWRTHIHGTDGEHRRTKVNITTATYTSKGPTNGSSLPYHNRFSEPHGAPVYTERNLGSQTYYAAKRQPLGDEHWDTRGHQSTSSKAPPKPWFPSQRTSKRHRSRERRRTRTPDIPYPDRQPSPSVIYPACISEPDTSINDPGDVVKMLPTPAASVLSRVTPPPAKHTSHSPRQKQPAAHADTNERRQSPYHRGDTATQSSIPAQSVGSQKTAARTQQSKWSSAAPLRKSANTTLLPNEQHPGSLLRQAVERSAMSSQAQAQAPPLTGHTRPRGLPRTWEEYYDTSPSMVNGPLIPPVSNYEESRPEPTKSTLPVDRSKAKTPKTSATASLFRQHSPRRQQRPSPMDHQPQTPIPSELYEDQEDDNIDSETVDPWDSISSAGLKPRNYRSSAASPMARTSTGRNLERDLKSQYEQTKREVEALRRVEAISIQARLEQARAEDAASRLKAYTRRLRGGS